MFNRFAHPAAVPIVLSLRAVEIRMRDRERFEQRVGGRRVVGKGTFPQEDQAWLLAQRCTPPTEQSSNVVREEILLAPKDRPGLELAELHAS